MIRIKVLSALLLMPFGLGMLVWGLKTRESPGAELDRLRGGSIFAALCPLQPCSKRSLNASFASGSQACTAAEQECTTCMTLPSGSGVEDLWEPYDQMPICTGPVFKKGSTTPDCTGTVAVGECVPDSSVPWGWKCAQLVSQNVDCYDIIQYQTTDQ